MYASAEQPVLSGFASLQPVPEQLTGARIPALRCSGANACRSRDMALACVVVLPAVRARFVDPNSMSMHSRAATASRDALRKMACEWMRQ